MFRLIASFCLAVLLLAGVPPARAQSTLQVDSALAQLDGVVADAMRRTGVPGVAVGVVWQDRPVYLKGFGTRDVRSGAPVTADTIFQLASVSKPIASTVMAALVGDGVIGWDDKVIDHDPGFRLYEDWTTSQVTLRDMFSHRSGLQDHAGDTLEDIGFDRATILQRLRYLPPEYSMRNGYAYTNFGMTEAGLAAAKTAGKDWETLSADRLYKPLGMESTSSRFADYFNAPNRASLHVRDNGVWTAKYVRDPDAQTPAGGVSSTVRDLAQWMRLQMNDGLVDGRQVVAPGALGETHRVQAVSRPAADPDTDSASYYGLGWNVAYDGPGRVRLNHAGAFGLGAATIVQLLPAEGLGIVVLTNGEPIGVADAIAQAFLDLATLGRQRTDFVTTFGQIYAAALAPNYGAAYRTRPAAPEPSQPLATYVGTYRNDFLGDVDVIATATGLAITLGPLRTPFPLTHFSGDSFTYQPIGENAYGPAGVVFSGLAGQPPVRMVIENFQITKGGTLTRIR